MDAGLRRFVCIRDSKVAEPVDTAAATYTPATLRA